MSTNWDAVKTGNLDELGAAIMERMSGQLDDPSSHEQEYADACLAIIERCKAAESSLAEAVGALRLLKHEVDASGNGSAGNDGWPKANAAAAAALNKRGTK